MENDMHSIGETARDSGLRISSLRFYDRAGVLVPAHVDPVTGYRWYAPEQIEEARLLARLRRAAMPLPDIRLVLAGWSGADTDLVRKLLEAHLHRLEVGLSDARSEFATLRRMIEDREIPMTSLRTAAVRLSASAPEVAAALAAVRFAAGGDPEMPMLAGVLFDVEAEAISFVATDRYRMAIARTATTGYDGPRVQAIVPAPLVDAMRALLTSEEPVQLTVDGDRVTLEAGDRQVTGQSLGHEFPDYRRLVRLPAGRRALVDVAAFRQALEAGPVRAGEVREQDGVAWDLSVLKVTADDTVTVCGDDDDESQVAVNREFLFDALTAGSRDRLILELGAPTAPIVIRRTDDEDAYSLLMPVRLDG
ncbi:MerR family transcriptional regulator [Streptomyces sp. NPDC015127]|uniref:DNA polymerase III subunit beta family protein n=1 Tax=Streptomyces sp. NPDC015127 TaxID=3364939 RepID=UPI0036F8AE6D